MTKLYTLSLLLLATIFTSNAQVEDADPNAFSFRLVSTPGFIELQAEDGCNWLTLSFSLWEEGDPVLVNQVGMLGPDIKNLDKHKANSTFLLKVERTLNGIQFTSYQGTEWTELIVQCVEEYCSMQVTNKGIEPYE